jgi:hypothetical protein
VRIFIHPKEGNTQPTSPNHASQLPRKCAGGHRFFDRLHFAYMSGAELHKVL